MTETEIIKFLKDNIEPIQDTIYGLGFRASVTLNDGTFLPCVIFRNSESLVDLAIRRFKEEQKGTSIFANKTKGFGYREIVKNFVATGNNINSYDIAKVEESRFAVPNYVKKQIHGETTMGWTAFVAEFQDGRKLSFGTTWNLEFFDMPNDYSFQNVTNIISGAYLSKESEIVAHNSMSSFVEDKEKLQPIYRQKVFFECFIDIL